MALGFVIFRLRDAQNLYLADIPSTLSKIDGTGVAEADSADGVLLSAVASGRCPRSMLCVWLGGWVLSTSNVTVTLGVGVISDVDVTGVLVVTPWPDECGVGVASNVGVTPVVGTSVGATVSVTTGVAVALTVGITSVGVSVRVGVSVGVSVGVNVGVNVGMSVGVSVGMSVGVNVG